MIAGKYEFIKEQGMSLSRVSSSFMNVDVASWLTCGAKTIYNSTVGTMFGGFGKYYSDNFATKHLEELRDQIGVNVRHNI